MQKITLSQAWVTKVTSDETAEDISVVWRKRSGLPTAEELSGIFVKLSDADAVREMVRRKWFSPGAQSTDRRLSRGRALENFLFPSGGIRAPVAAAAMYRRQTRQRDLVADLATAAWLCRVADKALAVRRHGRVAFDVGKLNTVTIQKLVRMSTRHSGPNEAIEFLRELGINVVLESALPGMYTDGASFKLKGVGPVVALTLRYDRLDSFWFTLLHEVGHVIFHLSQRQDVVFIDSFDDECEDLDESEAEAEANAFAKDAFVPRDAWVRSDALRLGTEASIIALAKKCHIHPAVVAGRVRFEKRKYHAHSRLLGAGEVRGTLLNE